MEALYNLTNLNYLDLNIGVNKCGPRGGEDLSLLIEKLKLLTFLRVNFYENYIQDAGLMEVTKSIKNL